MVSQKIHGVLDYTFLSLEQNLFFEEQLLNYVDNHKMTISFLRFWESPSYFIVLGRSNKPEIETFEERCRIQNIPIFKRCTGGGTVLQGPGCLNYALFFTFDDRTFDITSTNHFVMNSLQKGFVVSGFNVEVSGFTDLTINQYKFSGNAQRRKRQTLLFHGTVLYDFDLDQISNYLKYPSKSPDYRMKRQHENFVSNIVVSKNKIKNLIKNAFGIEYEMNFNDLKTCSGFELLL